MTLWLKVTKDKYELPLAVAGSSIELAKMCGTTKNSIESSISHAKKSGSKCCYVRVEESEE